jgi:2-methylcitrate dehydratase PrpD
MTPASDTPRAIPRLGAFIAAAARAHSPVAMGRTRTAFLDIIGCMLLGAPSEPARTARQTVAAWGQGGSVIVGTSQTTNPPWAALVNGVAAHAYDLDDYEDPGYTHPSAVLVPALLASCADLNCTGFDLLDAYIVGLEVIMRIGEAVNPSHYNMGWHSTRTLGTIGAAAAVARLTRLDGAKAANAISLATSMGGGFASQFGTTAKPLHAGLAAQGGIIAASLAANGATAGAGVLDGRASLASLMMAPGEANFQAFDRLAAPWGIEEHGLAIKIHSSCGYTHRAIDGALRLRTQNRVDFSAITEIRVGLTDPHRAIVSFDDPQTPAEALFSVPYTVALALMAGAVTPMDFTAAAITNPAIRALAAKVTVDSRKPLRPDVGMDPDDPDTVEITFADGLVLRTEVAAPKGTPPDPLSTDEVLAKVHRCAAASVDADQSAAIAGACARLDHVTSARELTALLMTR